MQKVRMIALGLVGVATAATVIFKYFRSTIPRHTIISILQTLNKESYQLMCQVSQMARLMITDKKLYPSQVKDIIEEPNNPVSRVLREMDQKVYQQHKVKEEDFVYAVERVYNKDPEVRFLQKRFSETYQKALLGVTPGVFIRSPVFMTEDKALWIMSRILDQELRLLKEEFEQSKGPLSLKSLRKAVETKLFSFKKQLVSEERLHELSDNPANILQFSLSQFSKGADFRQKIEGAFKDYQRRLSTLLGEHAPRLSLQG